MRYEAAHGILSLYKTKENVPQLAEFKGRFERRFREMSRDADERVAIKSVSRSVYCRSSSSSSDCYLIALFTVVSQLELLSQLVEKDQVDRDSVRVEIYPLLAASSPALRQAASSLVATLLLDTAAQAEERKLKEDKDDKEGGGPVGRGGRKGKKGASVSEEDEQARRHKVAMQCQLATLLDLMEILVQTQMAPPTNQGAGSSSAAAGVESITMTEEEVAKLVHCLYGRWGYERKLISIKCELLDLALPSGFLSLGTVGPSSLLSLTMT